MIIDINDPECDLEWCWERFRRYWLHIPVLINMSDIQQWARVDAQTSEENELRKLVDAWVSLGYMTKINHGWWRASK